MRQFTIITNHTNRSVLCDHVTIEGSFIAFRDSTGDIVAVASNNVIVVETK